MLLLPDMAGRHGLVRKRRETTLLLERGSVSLPMREKEGGRGPGNPDSHGRVEDVRDS